MLFRKAPGSCGKNILKHILQHFTSICMGSKSLPQIFKALFQTGDFYIFVLCGIFFVRYVQLKKVRFLTKEHQL